MSYYDDTYHSNDPTFLTAGADFVTKGLPAMAVSAGYGVMNTGVALGNAFGGDFKQRSAIQDLAANGGYSEDIARYYAQNETLVDVGGLIASSIIPGLAGVKALRAGQAALANSAAREGAGLLTRTASKLVGTADNHVTGLVRSIRGGKNTLTEVNKLRVAGGALRQATLESAIFETAAIMTNNQNSVMNADALDYFDAISENLDTIAFGTVFGGVLGGGIGGLSTWGKLKKAAKELDTSKEGLNKAGSLVDPTQLGANKGNNLVLSVKSLREGAEESAEIVPGVTPIALNNQLAAAAHNKRIGIKAQVAGLVPSFKPKDKEFVKLADAFPQSTPNQIVEDLHSIMINSEHGAEEIAKAFGGLEVVGYAGAKDTTTKALESAKLSFRERLSGIADDGRVAAEGEGYVESALERAYYGHRDPKLKDVKRRGSNVVETAEFQKDKVGSLQGMLNVMHTKLRDPAKALTMTEDEVIGLLTYSGRTKMKEILDTTTVGRTIKTESENFIKEFIPELHASLNKALNLQDLSKADYGQVGKILADYKLTSPDDLMALAMKTYKAKLADDGFVDLALKKFPTLTSVMKEKGMSERFLETSLFFNTETRAFSTQPLGLRAPDVAPVSLKNNRLNYGKGGELQIDSQVSIRLDAVLSEKATPVDMTAQWAYSMNSKFDTVKFLKNKGNIEASNLPHLQRVYNELKLASQSDTAYNAALQKLFSENPITIVGTKTVKGAEVASVKTISTIGELEKALAQSKITELNKLLKHNEINRKFSTEDIAEMLDVTPDYVMKAGATDDLAEVIRNGDYLKTRNVRMTYASDDPERAFSVGMGVAKVQRQMAARRAEIGELTANHFDEVSGILPPNALQRQSGFNPVDDISSASETQGLVKSTQANSMGEMFYQNIGKAMNNIQQKVIDNVSNSLSQLGRMIKSNTSATAEMGVVNQKLAQGDYGFLDGKILDAAIEANPILGNYIGKGSSTGMNLVPAKLHEAIMEGTDISKLADSDIASMFQFNDNITMEIFAIKDANVGEFFRRAVEHNGEFVKGRNDFNRLTGDSYDWSKSTFPAVHTKLSEAPHRAKVEFATSNSFGTPHGWITARTAEELNAKIGVLEAKMPTAKVRRVDQTEADSKILGDYEWDSALTSNSSNSDMRKLGIEWDVLPESSPRLVDDFVQSIVGRQLSLERKYLRQHYIEDFRALEMADNAINPATGKSENSFYTAQKKTMNAALGLRNTDEYKGLATVQEVMGKALNKLATEGSGLWYALAQTANEVKGGAKKSEEVWEALAKHAEHYNLPKVYESSTDYIMSTSKVSRDVAEKSVSKVNSVTSWLMLRADQVQGMVNVLSTPITSYSSIRELKNMIGGDLDKFLADAGLGVRLPTGELFESSTKVHMAAVADYFADKSIVKRLAEQGLVSHDLQLHRDVIENLGAAMAKGEASTINPLVEKIGKGITYLTDTSEQFTRFVVARSAERVIDSVIAKVPAEFAARLQEMKYSMMNTAVTKAHGNYIAAQRPTLFQGFGGQAIGLFQTYQFNLMQALTRHVEQGDRKAAMMMVGFQGSIFGAQSLPGFKLINDHIGQQGREHDDIYSTAKESFGKDLSHLLLYGAASSATLPFGTGVNFYTRGDLTPRSPILIPTSLDEVPMVSFTSKLIGSMKGALDAQGVETNTSTLWQFLAHNGFNRPMAGLGQLMMGKRTSADGTTLLAFDELDNRGLHAIAKLAGTTTTDESIMSDAFYRTRNYQSMRQAELNRLGTGVKAAIRNRSYLPISEVKQKYMETGGDGANFDRWYQHQASSVNEGTFTELKGKMTTPEGRYMQRIMD